ncbi:acyl carrier protein [Nonomuraea sediminis]|uniref:acyl carrier protein n=1 Tax=Nonomuraea sediminis TaxID=2835864 RepID=UPI001BDCF7DE|nr:acyl carrier protein [Nonomuraea sediminis]
MELRERLADMIAKATDGEVEPFDVLAGQARLTDLGVTSLAFLRLIDLVEAEFGVELDPAALDSLDELAAYLRQHA